MPHILLVDDDAHVRKSVCRLLRVWGYDARAVADGEAGLDAMREAPPALVLLDVTMPGLSGLGVLQAIAADPALAGVPVVMLSGEDDTRTREEAARLGA